MTKKAIWLSLLFLVGTVVNAAGQPTTIQTSIRPEDACRSGAQGGGYNAATGRWAWTCAQFNWHGWQDPTAAAESYYIDCTGDGTGTGGADASSCLRAGERRLIGLVHRAALAVYYTADGGTVHFTRFPGKDHGIYVDTPCGVDCPDPYYPDVAALPHFARSGYHHEVGMLRCGWRGVQCVGEGVPGVNGLSHNDFADPLPGTIGETPNLTGVWLIADRGEESLQDGQGLFEGRTVGTHVFGTGTSNGPIYCVNSSSSDPTCDRDSRAAQNVWRHWMVPDYFRRGMGAQVRPAKDVNLDGDFPPAICLSDGIGECSGSLSPGDTRTYCNEDADCAGEEGGTCTIGETTTTATCAEDRRYVCWNLGESGTDLDRANGGCVWDRGLGTELDLGPCQVASEAYTDLRETQGSAVDWTVRLPMCPEGATDADDCDDGNNFFELVTNGVITSQDTCVGVAGAVAEYKIAGSNMPGTTGNTDSGWGVSTEDGTIYVGLGTQEVSAFLVHQDEFDQRDGGFYRFGAMSADWVNRSTCPTGAEAPCDRGPVMNTLSGRNGVIEGGLFILGSAGSKSNYDGSGYAFGATWRNNTFAFNVENSMIDPNRFWTYEGNRWYHNLCPDVCANAFGGPILFRDETFAFNQANPIFSIGTGDGINGVRMENITFTGGGQLTSGAIFLIIGGQNHLFQNILIEGNSGMSLVRIHPGGSQAANAQRRSVKNVTFKNVLVTGSTLSSLGSIRLSCQPNLTDEYVENIVFDNIRVNPPNNDQHALVGFDCADLANSQMDESLGSVLIQNSAIGGNKANHCLFTAFSGAGDCWQSGVSGRAVWGLVNNSLGAPSEEYRVVDGYPLPIMRNNTISERRVADVLIGGRPAAEAGDCNELPAGTRTAIVNDTAANACTDAGANGILDGGGSSYSQCECTSAGTWTAL